jgi:hypothetical protein
MPSTPESEQMKAVVAYVAPLMKEHRFKKRRHSFNRPTADGLVHVLDFQMGAYEPIPPNLSLAEKERYVETRTRIFGSFSNSGTFTVNLGVHVPELEELIFALAGNPTPPTSFIPEYRCHVRQRLDHLVSDDDMWWRLDLPVAELGLLMTELIRSHGIPFLDRFPDRDAIFAQWEENAALVPWFSPARLQLAVIASRRGDEIRARELLQTHYDETVLHARHPGHQAYVEQVAAYLGLTITDPLEGR